MKRNSQKQQRINAELEAIIEEFGAAMRSANMEYISYNQPLTPRMSCALAQFHDYCERYYGKEA